MAKPSIGGGEVRVDIGDARTERDADLGLHQIDAGYFFGDGGARLAGAD